MALLASAIGVIACSGTDASTGPGDSGGSEAGGATGAGGGSALVGGAPGTGGAHTGGLTGAGGNVANTGGATPNNTGGMQGVGGARTGGAPGNGGTPATGGALATHTGGTLATNTGGTLATNTGGTLATNTGGMPGAGGARTGGAPGTGGAGTGGAPGTGGAATGGTKATGGAATGGAATGGGTSTINCSGPALTGGTQHCSSNATGTVGSLSYSIWSSGTGGCITPYGVGAAYNATWNNSADFLAGVGFQWNETQTYAQYGTISADYAYTKTGTAGGYSYIGIYGWSNNPLIEFYIVDDWFGSGPPTGGGTLQTTFTVDGGTYKVYTHQQVNQPSIHGTTTFMQYFSVRQTARQCGHISLTSHFSEWASLGLPLGVMASARLLTEVGGGVGSISYTLGNMTAQ